MIIQCIEYYTLSCPGLSNIIHYSFRNGMKSMLEGGNETTVNYMEKLLFLTFLSIFKIIKTLTSSK